MFGKLRPPVAKTAPDKAKPQQSATGSVGSQNAPPVANTPVAKPPAAKPAMQVKPKPAEPKGNASADKSKQPKNNRDKIDKFNALKMRIHRKLVEQLDLNAINNDDPSIRDKVGELIAGLCEKEDVLLNHVERQRLVSEILDETFGLGPLEVLLKDESISDILINGSRQIYVERRGALELTEVQFRDEDHLIHVIDKIVSAVGRRCDEVSPMVDARLKDGSRAVSYTHLTLPTN